MAQGAQELVLACCWAGLGSRVGARQLVGGLCPGSSAGPLVGRPGSQDLWLQDPGGPVVGVDPLVGRAKA